MSWRQTIKGIAVALGLATATYDPSPDNANTRAAQAQSVLEAKVQRQTPFLTTTGEKLSSFQNTMHLAEKKEVDIDILPSMAGRAASDAQLLANQWTKMNPEDRLESDLIISNKSVRAAISELIPMLEMAQRNEYPKLDVLGTHLKLIKQSLGVLQQP